MGRKREFDEDEVLRLAEQRFWRDGYRATSMQDLAEVSGVKPGSLFKAFGTKKDIYLRALQRYADHDSPRAHLLRHFDAPLMEALHSFYDEVIGRAERGEPLPCGCLVSNHVSELNSLEDNIAETSIDLMRSARQTIRLRLSWAVDQGELSPEAELEALAAHLFCTLQGLYVLSASTRSLQDMRQARDLALSLVVPYLAANAAAGHA